MLLIADTGAIISLILIKLKKKE